MKFVLSLFAIGVSMIIYGVFGMEPESLNFSSRQPEMIVGGGFVVCLAIAGLIGDGK